MFKIKKKNSSPKKLIKKNALIKLINCEYNKSVSLKLTSSFTDITGIFLPVKSTYQVLELKAYNS